MRFYLITGTLLCVLSLTARAQTCSTIPGASNYGTDLTVCHMPDQSSLSCSQDKGGMSYCHVEHANGFVSSANGNAGQVLIGLIVSPIVEHRARKAQQHARAAASLQLKALILNSDFLAYAQIGAAHLKAPLPEIEAWTNELEEFDRLQAHNLAGLQELFEDRRLFYGDHKTWRDIHDSSLIAACIKRKAARNIVAVYRQDKYREVQLPADVIQALAAVESDAALLDAECTSKEAQKVFANRNVTTLLPAKGRTQ